jgi:hypothetical protein
MYRTNFLASYKFRKRMILKKKKQAHIQPWDQGIIRTFKSKYRRAYLYLLWCRVTPQSPIKINILIILI